MAPDLSLTKEHVRFDSSGTEITTASSGRSSSGWSPQAVMVNLVNTPYGKRKNYCIATDDLADEKDSLPKTSTLPTLSHADHNEEVNFSPRNSYHEEDSLGNFVNSECDDDAGECLSDSSHLVLPNIIEHANASDSGIHFMEDEGLNSVPELLPESKFSSSKFAHRCDTPPASLGSTPPTMMGMSCATEGASLSSSWSSSGAILQSASAAAIRQRPVAYCAIGGSLEDPSGNSFRLKAQALKGGKYEFPSTLGLIPPSNQRNSNARSIKFDATPVVRTSKKSLIAANADDYKNNTNESQQKIHPVTAKANDDQNDIKSFAVAPVSPPRSTEQNRKSSSAILSNTTSSQQSNVVAELPVEKKLPSNLRRKNKPPGSDQSRSTVTKRVTISSIPQQSTNRKVKAKTPAHPPELFRPSSDAYTPRMGKKEIKYKPAEMRTPVQSMASPLGTLSRPNFRDALRRVAMILHQHVSKIERRFENKQVLDNDSLFKLSMENVFHEENYKTPIYKCTMVRVPMARSGMVYGLKRIRQKYNIPTESEIYDFAHQLFKSVQLSSECSIVCLIYIERLMETAKVPLLATTWRPIFMCGLLLASKVWQDLSSWNVEFASVYPQYSLESINRLELEFLRRVKWDLYISSSCYAKYYFALRALVEKPDFRQRYNRMVGGVDRVQASEALKIEKRSTKVKEEVLSHLSRSM